IGVPGELYLGGDQLARGYLHHPDLTADRFIPHPWSSAPGSRLYRTGDWARYRPDGTLEFWGRKDDLVKLRGFRIELGEIAAQLLHHPSVRAATAIAIDKGTPQARLAAYVVPTDPSTLANSLWPTTLRRHLADCLPTYAIPAEIVPLAELPIAPNGKVDRGALPIPDHIAPAEDYIPPRTPLEREMQRLWQGVLGMQAIGIHDNFFALGGHSLLVTQLLTRIQTTFQGYLTLRHFFDNPTIAGTLAHLQLQTSSSQTAINTVPDLITDTQLDERIIPSSQQATLPPQRIFLTGATGFFGAFLLAELLRQTTASVYCLVRCSNAAQGKQRLQSILQTYLLWNDTWGDRLQIVPGDLTLPQFGLHETDFDDLASILDAIYHNGAWVHHLYPYAILKASNVLGTQEAIRLACQGKSKPLHYISTPNVFSGLGHSGIRTIAESDPINNECLPHDGYVQSKWVAESLVWAAMARGLPASIYRPTRIGSHSQTGLYNPQDFLYRLIQSCLTLQSYPSGTLAENVMPVDFASPAIVYLSQRPDCLGKAFHLAHPEPLTPEPLVAAATTLGHPLSALPYADWRVRLLSHADRFPDSLLATLVPFFPAPNAESNPTPAAELHFCDRHTRTGLADASFQCPELTPAYFQRFLQRLPQTNRLGSENP
ncbi:MAG TPA: thioester reductase domain-containing protein, partial [Stenomitos sp.]